MFDYTDDVRIVSSFKRSHKPCGKTNGRLTHGFIFIIKGNAQYQFADETFTVREGEFIFLPKGSAFSYAIAPGESFYTSINFHATPCTRIFRGYLPQRALYHPELYRILEFRHRLRKASMQRDAIRSVVLCFQIRAFRQRG